MRPLAWLLGLALLTALPGIAVDEDGPRTFAALKKTLPKTGRMRTEALLAFAESDRPALKERLKAQGALASAKDASAEDVLSAILLGARLHGVGSDEKKRKRALEDAKKRAAGKTSQALDDALRADVALAEVKRARARKKPISDDDRRALDDGIEANHRLKDEARALRLLLETLLVDEAAGKSPGAILPKTNKLLRAGGEHRDLAAIRVDGRRLRARLLAATGKWEDAAHESLVADRAGMPSPKVAFSSSKKETPYRRSKETAKLCFEARAHAVSCAHLEEERMGGRTFYDFSKEKDARFSSSRHEAVMSEYDELLKRCVHVSEELSALDSRVELEWIVSPKGVVEDFTVVKPRFLQTSPFNDCAKEAFAQFRYPRFKGPPATVSYELSI